MLLLVNHFLQRTHCRRRTDLMPTYAPSWEQTSPSPPPLYMGGGDFDTQGECGSRSSCSPGGVGAATEPGVMVVTGSMEPAWAYPRPSRGRRLHNKRVHPGPQFLVGSSGQPLLPSAIPPTLSATGHQLPATYHNPVE
jgi:hypothetical protein